GNAEGAGAARGAGQVQAAGNRASEDDVRRVRRHDQARGRNQYRARQRRQAEVQLKRLPSPGLMLRRRVSAVSKHEAAPPFETRTSCAPQGEGGAMPYPAWLRSSSSIEI